MAYRFRKHYTVAEAQALLPQIRLWLLQLGRVRDDLERLDKQMELLLKEGADVGGKLANRWVAVIADFQDLACEFQKRDIQIKDIDRGLIDFPALIGGKEVFLCWENGEEQIEFWHDLDSGYAGRERL